MKPFTTRKNKNKSLKKIFKGGDNPILCSLANDQSKRKDCNASVIKYIVSKDMKCHWHNGIVLNGKTIKDKTKNELLLKQENRIGKGFYGSVYLSKFRYNNLDYNVIIKKQVIPNYPNLLFSEKIIESNKVAYRNEVAVLQYLTNHVVLKSLSPHFLSLYGHITCDEDHMLIAEQASGSLYNILSTQNLSYEFKSIVSQIIISIFMYHQYTKCYHNDTHVENFLYIDTQQKISLKYNFHDKIYYVNCDKFLINIWDLGLTSNIQYDLLLNVNTNNYLLNILRDYIYVIVDIYQKYKSITVDNIKYLANILHILLNYNDMMRHDLNKMKNLFNTKTKYILRREEELFKKLIDEQLIFDAYDTINRRHHYNQRAYDVNNSLNITPPVLEQSNSIKFQNLVKSETISIMQRHPEYNTLLQHMKLGKPSDEIKDIYNKYI